MTLDEEERLKRVQALKEKKRIEDIERDAVRRRINEDRVSTMFALRRSERI